MRKQYRVFELELRLRYAWKNVSRSDIRRISERLNPSARRAKHAANSVSIVFVSEAPGDQLMNRIGPVLDQISVILDWTLAPRPSDVWSKNGINCPFATVVRAAWETAVKLNKAEYDRERWPGKVRIKHGVKKFAGETELQMQMRFAREGKFLSNADRPKR